MICQNEFGGVSKASAKSMPFQMTEPATCWPFLPAFTLSTYGTCCIFIVTLSKYCLRFIQKWLLQRPTSRCCTERGERGFSPSERWYWAPFNGIFQSQAIAYSFCSLRTMVVEAWDESTHFYGLRRPLFCYVLKRKLVNDHLTCR